MVKLCLGGVEIAQNVMLDLKVVYNELWVRHNGIPEGCELVAMYKKFSTKGSNHEKGSTSEKKWKVRCLDSHGKEPLKFTKGKPYKWYIPQRDDESLYTISANGELSAESESSSAARCLSYSIDFDIEDDKITDVYFGNMYRKHATTWRNIHMPFALAIVKWGGTGPHGRNQIIAFRRFNINVIYDTYDGVFKETLNVV